MARRTSPPPEDLWQGLRQMIRHPVRTIVPPWSWKAAAFDAFLRASAFFVTNLRSGNWQATKAMLIEAVFAIFAGGLIGAISQRLRRAKPVWATALVICVGLPGALVLAQYAVHRIAGTPHLGTGILASFLLAALAAGYTWYAMRHGAMLGGNDQTPFLRDLKVLPGISLDFALAIPRLLAKGWREQ